MQPGLKVLAEMHGPLLWGMSRSAVDLRSPPREMFESPTEENLWRQPLGRLLLC